MAESRFPAMGSWAHVVVFGGPDAGAAAEAARARVDQLERRWSRFLPDSEISRWNRRQAATVVSSETAALIARAVAARQATGGRFDPFVLAAVVEAYGVVAAPRPGFDPGGIGKGYAADVVCEELMAAGADGACVNLGGDMRVEGVPAPDGPPWVIDVEDPFHPGGPPLARVGLNRGAVATSNRLRRSWRVGGEARHHLIDPATGRPAVTDAVAVTVVAGNAWWAEALATAAVVAGAERGRILIDEAGSAGLIVDEAGGVHTTSGMAAFLDRDVAPDLTLAR